MSDHFYLTLDSRNTTVEGNRAGRFSTHLPAPLHLGDGWSVALVEITYPKTWQNIPNRDYFVEGEGFKVTLPPGFYGTTSVLLASLNYHLRKFSKQPPQFSYDSTDNRVALHGAEGARPSEALGGILGYDPDQKAWGKWEADIQAAFHRLFVYADCVAEGFVGDVSAPLLRAVEVPPSADRFGEVVHLSYPRPWYLPLSRRSITEIEVLVADEFGREVKFQGRKNVRITLHFRHG